MRQYIGARYVPRFTGLYDVTQEYEALDVVDNGSGTSYIAKKPTPAGTPLTDTNYWFLYGSTSGAIVDLQQQINDMNDGTVPGSLQSQINSNASDIQNLTDEVELIEGGITVTVADSYGTVTTPNWGYYLASAMGIDNANFVNLAQSGAGFYNGEFLNLITPGVNPNSIPASIDRTKVTRIIVAGGFNDRNFDPESGISAFMNYAKTQYPNAKVYIGFIGWSFNEYYVSAFAQNVAFIKYTQCAKYGAIYLNGSEDIMHNRSFFVAETPAPELSEQYSYVHPNANGCQAIGLYLANAIRGGKCTVEYPYISGVYEALDSDAAIFGYLNQQLEGNSCRVLLYDFRVVNNVTPFTITNRNTPIKIAKAGVGTNYIAPQVDVQMLTYARIIGGTYVTEKVVPVYLTFRAADLYAQFPTEDPNATFTNLLFYNTEQKIKIYS